MARKLESLTAFVILGAGTSPTFLAFFLFLRSSFDESLFVVDRLQIVAFLLSVISQAKRSLFASS